MRPSQGKRARDLETGSRTGWASLQLPESVSFVRLCTLTSSSRPYFVPGSVPGSVRVCFLCFCVCLKVSGRSWQWQVLITMFAAVSLFDFYLLLWFSGRLFLILANFLKFSVGEPSPVCVCPKRGTLQFFPLLQLHSRLVSGAVTLTCQLVAQLRLWLRVPFASLAWFRFFSSLLHAQHAPLDGCSANNDSKGHVRFSGVTVCAGSDFVCIDVARFGRALRGGP